MTTERIEAGGMAAGRRAVGDLRRFLAGDWAIARTIRDRRAAVDGRFTGTASYVAEAGGLAYRESGRLVMGGHDGPAMQCHHYSFPAPARAEIRFRDGRPFHALDLSGGGARAVHACPPDLYRARFLVLDADRWCVVWRVRGPRKDLTIASRFTRRPPTRRQSESPQP